MSATFLAVDFGASNGRVIAGWLENEEEGKKLQLREVYRFPNRPVRIGDYLYWDFPALYAEMIKGLTLAASQFPDIRSIGIDTWGVDFGLVDRLGNLVGNPICYRDPHTAREVEEFASRFDATVHYAEAGIQMLPINTMYRLISMQKNADPKLEIARNLLFMPDLFAFYLTGKLGVEYTIASTSELLNALERNWNHELLKELQLPSSLFGEIQMPGTVRGCLTENVCRETGLGSDVKVIAVGSHDTASAVFAMADDYDATGAAYLSSGTWSLLGIVTDTPVLSEEARLAGFTNEGGVGGKIRLLTNITGLWILQQLMHQWKQDNPELDWTTLTEEGERAKITALIDVDDPIFQNPEGMQQSIESYCKEHALQVPATRGEFVKCVCASLAERYRKAIDSLNSLLPKPVSKLIVFGGGSKNSLLNRLTGEATGLQIIVREAEATAIGNLMLQALSQGFINDKQEIIKTVIL